MAASTPTEAYCVKCKTKQPLKDAQPATMKNGRNALKGTCPVCGTTLYRIQGAAAKASAAKK